MKTLVSWRRVCVRGGGSLGLTIPVSITKTLGIEDGTIIDVYYDSELPGIVLMKSIKQPPRTPAFVPVPQVTTGEAVHP